MPIRSNHRLATAALGALALAAASVVSTAAEAGCTVYQHRDYQGARWGLGDGEDLQMGGEPMGRSSSHGNAGEIFYEPGWNDQISSFKVTSGCEITLWQHVGSYSGAGASFVSTSNYKYVGGSWNDQASWVECRC